MEQDLGSEHTRSLHRYILPGSSLPPQEDRAGVHTWRAEQHHRCLRVLCIQPQAAHGNEVQGGRVLRRQPTAAAHCWKNAFGWSRSAWDYISRHQHWWGLPYSDRPWCGVGNQDFTNISQNVQVHRILGARSKQNSWDCGRSRRWNLHSTRPTLCDKVTFGCLKILSLYILYQDHLRLWWLGSEE